MGSPRRRCPRRGPAGRPGISWGRLRLAGAVPAIASDLVRQSSHRDENECWDDNQVVNIADYRDEIGDQAKGPECVPHGRPEEYLGSDRRPRVSRHHPVDPQLVRDPDDKGTDPGDHVSPSAGTEVPGGADGRETDTPADGPISPSSLAHRSTCRSHHPLLLEPRPTAGTGVGTSTRTQIESITIPPSG